VLKRCQEVDLILNWEKCHFLVWEGIIIGHKKSEKGIEVDKEKIEVTELEKSGLKPAPPHAG
jgi:hypothetical protein